ncbi:MAG: alkaline phosphatase family protein [Planctomycetota bacterium]
MRFPRTKFLLLATALLAAACSKQPESPPPVLLIAVDGLEWNVMLPLLRAGELPHLERLIERGSAGELRTFQPTLSPIVWTSVATGRTPEAHGIHAFSKPAPAGTPLEEIQLFDNSDRRTKALWNIATDGGRSVAVIGWWMTFPVEPVNGLMVSQTNSSAQLAIGYGRNIWKGGFLPGVPGQVWPPGAEARIVEHAERAAAELDAELIETFGTFPYPLTPLGRTLWDNTRWSFRSDSTYLRIAEEALASEKPHDLVCVYLGNTDVVGHRFWRYYRPDLFRDRPNEAELANLGEVLEASYRWTDAAIGRLVAAAGDETRIVIVSDHGMYAVNRDKVFDAVNIPADVNSGNHITAPSGVWIAAGPDLVDADLPPARSLERDDLSPVATVYDVAPTVLVLLGLPVGADMDGGVPSALIEPAFLVEQPFRTVPTHDTPEFLAGRELLEAMVGEGSSKAQLERLRELGYIGPDSVEATIHGEK